jgi:uncharacterized protein (TIGR02118 family)
MVKIFYLIPKRPDISDEQFHSHWRGVHAELALRIKNLRRYVQSHRIKHAGFGLSSPYEGIAEVWFDSLDAAKQMRDSREYIDGAFADEPNFIDTSRLTWLATQENVVLDGPAMSKDTPSVKALFFPKRKPGMSVADYQHYWRTTHGPIVPKTPGLLRYVQCHVLPETYQEGTPAYDGVAELWWPNVESLEKAAVSPEFRVEQLNDARQFVGVDDLEGFVAEENRVIWP